MTTLHINVSAYVVLFIDVSPSLHEDLDHLQMPVNNRPVKGGKATLKPVFTKV